MIRAAFAASGTSLFSIRYRCDKVGAYKPDELRLLGPYSACTDQDFHTSFWVLGHLKLEELHIEEFGIRHRDQHLDHPHLGSRCRQLVKLIYFDVWQRTLVVALQADCVSRGHSNSILDLTLISLPILYHLSALFTAFI
jgi:hypothetical protein